MIKRKLGEKGQVVIPKDVRKYLGLKEGSEVVFEVRHGEVLLKPDTVDPKKIVEDFCNIVPKGKRIRLSSKKIKKILEEQYDLP